MQYSKGAMGTKNRYRKYVDLAFEYQVAALSLWTSVVESPFLYNPCMFLARHTIELLLKSLIIHESGGSTAVKIGIGKEKRALDNTHNLSLLWDYYVEIMSPHLFLAIEEVETIGKGIKKFSQIDIDSTKYRYPEAKRSFSSLKLEPIKVEPFVFPELTKTPPLIVSTQTNKIDIITAGTAELRRGKEAFELIEMLFQAVETRCFP